MNRAVPRVGRSWFRQMLPVALLIVTALAAAQGDGMPPAPTAPRPLNIEAPVEQSLPNGLRIVLARRPGVQLVSAQLVVLTGSEADPAQRAGLASLTAALLTRGTRHYSASALARAAESLGGALGGAAGWHQTELGITVTPPRLDEALALVSEALQYPRFDTAELDRLRDQTLDELKLAYAEPGTMARLAAQRLAFGAGAYGQPAAGTPRSLPRITRRDVSAFHAAHFRPNNAVLILAGDLELDEAMALARRHFARWTASPRALSTSAAQRLSAQPMSTPLVLIDMPEAGQAAVVLAAALPPLGRDRATGAVLNAVLGGGYSSRLNQEIRIRRGLSYFAGSSIESRPMGGELRVLVQTKNESAREVLDIVQAELRKLASTPVPTDELEARKATLIGNFSRSLETTSGLGSAIRGLIVAGLPVSELGERMRVIGAVSPADVQGYAANQLAAAAWRTAVAGDAARFTGDWKAGPAGAMKIPAAALDLERPDRLAAP